MADNLVSSTGAVHARLRPGALRFLCRSGERHGNAPAASATTDPVTCRSCISRQHLLEVGTQAVLDPGPNRPLPDPLGPPPPERNPQIACGNRVPPERHGEIRRTARHAVAHIGGSHLTHKRVDPAAAWGAVDRGQATVYAYPDGTHRVVESALLWWTLTEEPAVVDPPGTTMAAVGESVAAVAESDTLLMLHDVARVTEERGGIRPGPQEIVILDDPNPPIPDITRAPDAKVWVDSPGPTRRSMWNLAYGYALGVWHTVGELRRHLPGLATHADVVEFAGAYSLHHGGLPRESHIPVPHALENWRDHRRVTKP